MSQRTELVSLIMDHPSYEGGTAEEWVNKRGLSFETATEDEIKGLIKELKCKTGKHS